MKCACSRDTFSFPVPVPLTERQTLQWFHQNKSISFQCDLGQNKKKLGRMDEILKIYKRNFWNNTVEVGEKFKPHAHNTLLHAYRLRLIFPTHNLFFEYIFFTGYFFETSLYFLSLFFCSVLSVCCFVVLFVFEVIMNCRYDGWLGRKIKN